ncbi:imelysin family protein [Psychrobacter sp. I-STPA6b]|uniref:imelysin family protein n=1 Tax=Psychrobacter sp. I-STPA6b TaxID=2585718 RepID=UPI001D0C5EC6|nr:imelysin family protein [Psychrobacter sp. I-STPA6b]
MKKHQLAAMILSAISAGILVSCSKPSDEQTAASSESKATSATETENLTEGQAADNSQAEATEVVALELSDEAMGSYLQHVIEQQIVPAYAQATQQSQLLNEMAQKSCQTAPVQGDELQALRAQWLKLATAWASAEVVNFGPATESMTNLYINYFPDERGLIHNGIKELIEANPKLTATELAHESAIVQGVPGLEEMLYANDSLDTAQCNYVISASAALTTRLQAIESEWTQHGNSLLVADTDNKAGLNRWLNSVLSLVETTKSNSLDKPLGLTGSKKGHLPAATAGQSRAIMTAKVAALNDALTDPVFTALLAQPNNSNAIGEQLSTELANTTTLLAQMPEDLAQASPEAQQQLYDNLTKITQLIKRQLIPTLGVQVGFNSTDGD